MAGIIGVCFRGWWACSATTTACCEVGVAGCEDRAPENEAEPATVRDKVLVTASVEGFLFKITSALGLEPSSSFQVDFVDS